VKNIGVILLVVILSGCAARTSGPAGPAADGAPGVISEASVRGHMEFLAGDAMNGRGSGTRDEWIAASYVASHLRRLGLEPLGDDGGYLQTIEIERPELAAPPALSFGGSRYVHGKQINVITMNSASTSGPFTRFQDGQAVPTGSVVLVEEVGKVARAVRPAAMVLAKSKGCGGFRLQPGALPRISPRTLGVPPPAARPACVALDDETHAAAARLAPGAVVTLAGEVKTIRKTRTWNAVGRLTGTDLRQAQEAILLSAHIDHVGNGRGQAPAGGDNIYNGADDDASGSVAVLELAGAIAGGPRPRRTIVFAWFGSEESGGAGSRYFADRPVVPLDAIVANLQFEMIGRPDAKVPRHTLWLTGYERSTLGPELARRGARLVQDPRPEQQFFTRSDNIELARRGVIAHTVSSFGLHKDYHQPSDEIGTIDFAHMTDAIRSMVEPVRWLGNASFKPDWLPGQRPE
jgi:hypothetical protein